MLHRICTLTDALGRLARQCLRFQNFEFDVAHRAGFEHRAAEALLQLPTDGEDTTDFIDELPVLTILAVDKAKDVDGNYENTA